LDSTKRGTLAEAPNIEVPSRDAIGVVGRGNASRLGVWESVVSFLSGVRGGAPAENNFRAFLSVSE